VPEKKEKTEQEAPHQQEETKPGQTAPKNRAAATSVPSASNTNDASRGSSPLMASDSGRTPAPLIRLAGLQQIVPTADFLIAEVGTDAGKSGTRAPDANSAPLKRHRGRVPARQNGERNGHVTQVQTQSDAPARRDPSANEPGKTDHKTDQDAPIVITRGADGRLVITSRDTQALDALEEMVTRLAPPRKDYAVYYLKHADSYTVKLNLDEFFQSEKKETGEDRARRWWWDDSSNDKKDDSPKLSRRKPLRFIEDSQTNSILVQGASADQLRQIEELIKMYDNPKPTNTRPSRVTQIFYIKHSRASVIAEVLKDAYRDLLSSKDKALESYNQTKNQGRGQRGYISYDFGEHEDDGKMSQGRFSGALSLGIDDSTNTLLVSCASQNMMLNIKQIVESLDTAAVPAAQTFQVLQINRSIDTAGLQKKLSEMLKKPTTKPESTQQPGQGQQPQQQRRGRGGQNHESGENSNE